MKTRILPLLLVALGSLSWVPGASAQLLPGTLLYETSFTGADGTSPADWGAYTTGNNLVDLQGNSYAFQRVDHGGGMFAWYEGGYNVPGGGVLPANQWADYRVETVVRSTQRY